MKEKPNEINELRATYANERQNTFLINNNRSVFLTIFALHFDALRNWMLSAVWVTEDCYCCRRRRRSSHLHGSCAMCIVGWMKVFFSSVTLLLWAQLKWNSLLLFLHWRRLRSSSFHFLIASHARNRFTLSLLARIGKIGRVSDTFIDIFRLCFMRRHRAAAVAANCIANAIRFLLITIIYSKTKRKRRTIVASGLLRLIGHFRHRCDGADLIGLRLSWRSARCAGEWTIDIS